MKRKIAISLLLVLIAAFCCGCALETTYKGLDNTTSKFSYEQDTDNDEEDTIRDITNKRKPNDHTPTAYITRAGKRYHKPYCSHAKSVYMFLTVSQAIDRGYTACYYCCY